MISDKARRRVLLEPSPSGVLRHAADIALAAFQGSRYYARGYSKSSTAPQAGGSQTVQTPMQMGRWMQFGIADALRLDLEVRGQGKQARRRHVERQR